MAIHRLLQDTTFGPAEIKAVITAYDDACRALKLAAERSDPITKILAAKIIEIAKGGERDPAKICEAALREMHLPRA